MSGPAFLLSMYAWSLRSSPESALALRTVPVNAPDPAPSVRTGHDTEHPGRPPTEGPVPPARSRPGGFRLFRMTSPK